MKDTLGFITFLAYAALINTADAAISAWTEPNASGQDVDAAAAQTIAESLATGTSTGVIIQATGVGTVTYAIFSQPTAGKLTIDPGTGELTLAVGTFDFETATTYVLTIVGTDDNDASQGTATVTLSITNVNEAPTFASNQYEKTVPNGSTQNTALITVSATDEDVGDAISYSITAGGANSHFAISVSGGAITVSAGTTLDANTLNSYSLTVTVTDGGGLTDTTTVTITVDSGAGAVAAASILSIFVAITFLLY